MSMILLFLASLASSSRISYEGEQVIQCVLPRNESLLRHLGDTLALDIWAIRYDGSIDVRVQNENQKLLVQSLLGDCEVMIDDVELYIQEHEAERLKTMQTADDWFLNYHTYNELTQWYQEFAANYPGQVRYVPTIGTSYEGRIQPAVHIAGNVSQDRPRSGFMYWQCLIHAREWISGATCNYLVNQLVTKYVEGDPDARFILDNIEIAIVPFVNPDGYSYTWTNDRMWRKNRRPNPGSNCAGTDLNRNYPEKWGNGGGSQNPCSETFEGSAAASEVETRNTIAYYNALASKQVVLAMIDWHSYGQLINRPWGWTPDDCPDEDVIRAIGDQYVADVLKVHGRTYINQKAYQLYETSGTSRDYFYGNGSQYNNGFRSVAWTIELRPTSSRPGFELPPVEIIPTGQENYAGIINFAKWFIANGPLPIKP